MNRQKLIKYRREMLILGLPFLMGAYVVATGRARVTITSISATPTQGTLAAQVETATYSPTRTPTQTQTIMPSPTSTFTPLPNDTPTITPTFTPNPTEIVEAYLSQLGSFLATSHDVDVMDLDIEAGTLQIRVQSHRPGESLLRITSWQIIQDLAQLLQLIGPNADLLVDIIGTEEYSVALLVLSVDESLGYRSETSRETFNAVQSRSVSNQQWEVLANGHFEEF